MDIGEVNYFIRKKSINFTRETSIPNRQFCYFKYQLTPFHKILNAP